MTFKEFIRLHEGDTGDKTGLYPMGYGGIGLYPPQTYLTGSADGIYYLSRDDRLYSHRDGKPFSISHIPGRPSHSKPHPGEGPPWPISHIPR